MVDDKEKKSENKEEEVKTSVKEDISSEEISSLKKQLKDSNEKYVRLLADFDNFKKRSAKERIEFLELAEKDLILELLCVVDDFDRALSLDSKNEGLVLISSKLNKVLESKGLQRIKTNIGDDFDETIHDAIARNNTDDKNLDGKIINIVESGYMFRSRIIRFTKVIIGEYKK